MKNTMKTAAFGATLIAGVAGVNTVAHADTVEAPQATETASTVQSVHTTQADVDSAKQNIEQAKDNVKFVNDSLEQQKLMKRKPIQPSKLLKTTSKCLKTLMQS